MPVKLPAPVWRFAPASLDPGSLPTIGPLFADLAARPLTTRGALERWLVDESELLARIHAEVARRYVRMTCHTDDHDARQAYLHMEQVESDAKRADGLCVGPGARITRVRRVMRAEGRPVAYLIDSLPVDYLAPDDLPAEFGGSVLDFLLARGSDLQLSRAAISATNASADVAKPLEINALLRAVDRQLAAQASLP